MDKERIRTILNILFLIGTAVALILYFTVDDRRPFFYTCATALILKMIEVVLRMIRYK